jgi:hypothetical protein
VVGWAAWALGKIGTKARPAMTLLKKLKEKTQNPALKHTFEESIDAIEGVKTPVQKGSLLCPEPRWFTSSPLYASAWEPEVYTPSRLFWARIEVTGRKS